MKINITIDCTPQEARTFFGLPNIEPMQDALIAQLQGQLSRYLDGSDPEKLIEAWLPANFKGLGQMQEQLWKNFVSTMGAAAGPSPKPSDER